MLDPQMHRFLSTLADNGGRMLVHEAEFEEAFAGTAADRAARQGFAKLVSDGGFGVKAGYEITKRGRAALREPGISGPPRRQLQDT